MNRRQFCAASTAPGLVGTAGCLDVLCPRGLRLGGVVLGNMRDAPVEGEGSDSFAYTASASDGECTVATIWIRAGTVGFGGHRATDGAPSGPTASPR